MSNAQRQAKFRAAHPGYYSRRRIKFRATIAAPPPAAAAPVEAANPAAPATPVETAAPAPQQPHVGTPSHRLRFAA